MVKRKWGTQSDAEPATGEYEQIRLARMEENRKRMMELGLADLSQSMSRDVRESFPRKRHNQPRKPSVPRPLEPARRSARLQSNPPPSYREISARGPAVERGPRRDARKAGTGGCQPEIYTEEHEKLLGDAKKEWDLFKDGYTANGERIYDPGRGKTCHQCRQKTMGLRTSCSDCQSLQGQFCGDCLYMRYGENVEESLQNRSWRCPICRDICNCSICRTRKGWAPTGALYRRAIQMGYKSVAHFLILTRRACVPRNPDEEQQASSGLEEAEDVPAKRMLQYDPEKQEGKDEDKTSIEQVKGSASEEEDGVATEEEEPKPFKALKVGQDKKKKTRVRKQSRPKTKSCSEQVKSSAASEEEDGVATEEEETKPVKLVDEKKNTMRPKDVVQQIDICIISDSDSEGGEMVSPMQLEQQQQQQPVAKRLRPRIQPCRAVKVRG